MNHKLIYYLFTFLSTFFISCGTEKNKAIETETDDGLPPNTIQLRETVNEEDLDVNEYLTERLKPIRENFKRINSIKDWTSIDTQELWDSTEGGEAKYYYQSGQLEKIITRHFGETFQQLTEYYLMNGQLSFVFEKSYRYNRPIYYDTIVMKENNDTEAFGFDISEIIEDRSYFENSKLLHKIEDGNNGASYAADYLIEEEKRMIGDFNYLIKHILSDFSSEFRDLTIVNLFDPIFADFNGDGYKDKATFKKDNKTSGIIIEHGKTNEVIKIGFGEKFAHLTEFNWVDFWGLVKDLETYEIVIEDSEIIGGKKVMLENPSILIRKEEAGGGLITFKNGKYQWIHQAD
ncbi:hypothetical protein MMU07_09270 [Aquiflexum sp. LQ15W]|uniref:hypothetical protein n=1 Tax=Cognataquiflexum nitidum TaxID=2922272 RepID=UPI001F136BC6|nr:hypothetical protein [Cognataquiflexum nitidum]MCH6199770.1 hypothetical protein [Cognataquiflexum nitidum]